jgi:hypothetical protein
VGCSMAWNGQSSMRASAVLEPVGLSLQASIDEC